MNKVFLIFVHKMNALIFRMRCKNITRGYGLPDKYFSSNIRCPHCCIEWKKNTEIKVKMLTECY